MKIESYSLLILGCFIIVWAIVSLFCNRAIVTKKDMERLVEMERVKPYMIHMRTNFFILGGTLIYASMNKTGLFFWFMYMGLFISGYICRGINLDGSI